MRRKLLEVKSKNKRVIVLVRHLILSWKEKKPLVNRGETKKNKRFKKLKKDKIKEKSDKNRTVSILRRVNRGRLKEKNQSHHSTWAITTKF